MKLEKDAEFRKWQRVVGHVKIMMLYPCDNVKPLIFLSKEEIE